MKQTSIPNIVLSGSDIYEACATTRSYEDISSVRSIVEQLKRFFKEPSEERTSLGKVWNDIRYRYTATQKASTKHYQVVATSTEQAIDYLDTELRQYAALRTVSRQKLEFVAKNVSDPRRYFALTTKETTFLPIWLNGQSQPTSQGAANYLGNLLYTPDGTWYIQFLTNKVMAAYGLKNLGDKDKEIKSPVIDSMGTSAIEHAKNMVNYRDRPKFDPHGRHANQKIDVGFEYLKLNGINAPFKRISAAQYKNEIGNLFESWRALAKKGVQPIHEMKVLDPQHFPNDGENHKLPENKQSFFRS